MDSPIIPSFFFEEETNETDVDTLLARLKSNPEISVPEMQILCKKINDAKSYDFSPLVIHDDELESNLFKLKTGILPTRSNGRKTLLVKTLFHWYLVEIWRNPLDLTLKVYLQGAGPIWELPCNTDCYLKVGVTHIYQENNCLQYDKQNCAFFALYAARKLLKIENYIPGGITFFEYLETRPGHIKSYGSFYVTKCIIPLALILPGQSHHFWTTHLASYPPEEQNHPINKRGALAGDTFHHHLVENSDNRGHLRNHFIDYFRDKTIEYLREEPALASQALAAPPHLLTDAEVETILANLMATPELLSSPDGSNFYDPDLDVGETFRFTPSPESESEDNFFDGSAPHKRQRND